MEAVKYNSICPTNSKSSCLEFLELASQGKLTIKWTSS